MTCELCVLVCSGLDTQLSKFHRLHSRLHIFEWCMCPCMWTLCIHVTATSGSRLPIGLGNGNDKFSQLVSPTGQVNQSSHTRTVRPRILIGQDHQVQDAHTTATCNFYTTLLVRWSRETTQGIGQVQQPHKQFSTSHHFLASLKTTTKFPQACGQLLCHNPAQSCHKLTMQWQQQNNPYLSNWWSDGKICTSS